MTMLYGEFEPYHDQTEVILAHQGITPDNAELEEPLSTHRSELVLSVGSALLAMSASSFGLKEFVLGSGRIGVGSMLAGATLAGMSLRYSGKQH